jgi:hypothetical protein
MLEMHSRHVYMSTMNWGAFDLNLLIVFDAVMQERSVTRGEPHRAEPARALSRCRTRNADEIACRPHDEMSIERRTLSLSTK